MRDEIARRVARKAKEMTRQEVVVKAIAGKITWIQAAQICGITARHMRRLKERYEKEGGEAFCDHRGGQRRRKRIPAETIRELCRLKQEVYPDFSMRHFHEFATEEHGVRISYSWTRFVLQEAGIEEKAPARGKHRRKRERRPMVGMLLHIDGSTHEWIAGLPKRDLVLVMDDSDGRALYGKFFEEEGTMSTFASLRHVVTRYGRFCELYHDRGSHFGRTSKAEDGPDEEQNGHVSVALRALGIRQIFARSPQARGRSERCFGTFQGRLPQELRLKGIRSYAEADKYLERVFLPKFNRQFTVKPAQPESAFVKLVGIDVDLLLSARHERIVRNDNTVTFNKTILQIPADKHRHHYVRCPVVVHELPDERLGISYQGRLLAFYDADGTLIAEKKNAKKNKSA